ncbi:MAG: hypothetical protein GY851_10425, partial [bacterium]|nr:hypothetical protein [bacterium]
DTADQEVTITGRNLEGATITIGGAKARPVDGAKQDADEILVNVPVSSNPGSADVTATNAAGSFTWPDGYLYYPAGERGVRRVFDIWPEDAWLIGGITAQIRGTSLWTNEGNPTGLAVSFTSELGTAVFEVLETDEFSATVKIPALKGVTEGQKALGTVFAQGQAATGPDFTYWRYRGNEDTAITTAFNLDDKRVAKCEEDTFEIVLNGGASGPAKILFTLPD